MATANRRLALLLAGLLGACGGGSPTAPPSATPTPRPSPTPTATPTPVPTPSATPPANHAPIGVFRVTPEPDSQGVIAISPGDIVRVNGSRFRDPDGDRLFLGVDWGDHTTGRIDCGPCRLEHRYVRIGTHSMRATITDTRLSVTLGLTVSVR